MLELTATAAARAALRTLERDDPAMFARIAERIEALRNDPGGRGAGATFRLDDGRTARVVSLFDATHSADWALVFQVNSDADGAGTLRVLHVGIA